MLAAVPKRAAATFIRSWVSFATFSSGFAECAWGGSRSSPGWQSPAALSPWQAAALMMRPLLRRKQPNHWRQLLGRRSSSLLEGDAAAVKAPGAPPFPLWCREPIGVRIDYNPYASARSPSQYYEERLGKAAEDFSALCNSDGADASAPHVFVAAVRRRKNVSSGAGAGRAVVA